MVLKKKKKIENCAHNSIIQNRSVQTMHSWIRFNTLAVYSD